MAVPGSLMATKSVTMSKVAAKTKASRIVFFGSIALLRHAGLSSTICFYITQRRSAFQVASHGRSTLVVSCQLLFAGFPSVPEEQRLALAVLRHRACRP